MKGRARPNQCFADAPNMKVKSDKTEETASISGQATALQVSGQFGPSHTVTFADGVLGLRARLQSP